MTPDDAAARRRTRPRTGHGTVVDFDDDIGLGTVRSCDGVEVIFHCTQVADGTRHVEVGTDVTFGLLAGRHGRWEAAALRTVPSSPPGPPPPGPSASGPRAGAT